MAHNHVPSLGHNYFIAFAIGWNAVAKIRNPGPIAGTQVMVVAGIGVVISGLLFVITGLQWIDPLMSFIIMIKSQLVSS